MVASGNVQNPKLIVKDCWDSTIWDSAKLIELVGIDKVDEIKRSTICCNTFLDKFLWEPTSMGQFSTRLTWDIVREKWAMLRCQNEFDIIKFSKRSLSTCAKLIIDICHVMIKLRLLVFLLYPLVTVVISKKWRPWIIYCVWAP